jgi:Transglutaminase-like superfamily
MQLMSIKKLLCLLILLTNIATAQNTSNFAYKSYSWDANPKLSTLSEKEKEGDYVFLKDKTTIEYAYETSGDLVRYITKHVIIHFNNKKGVEDMNKVYISSESILDEMELKARTITAAGKVIPLDKNTVKRVDDLEGQGPFIYFAMEGIDVGGEIEYIYTNKVTASVFGSWKVQSQIIRKNYSMDIYSPGNLVFEAKGYNGFPEFKIDTTLEDKNHIHASIDYIDGITEEKYSAYEANRMRFDMTLTYNYAQGKSRMYSWEYCGNNLFDRLFVFEKQETKAIEKLIGKLNLKNMKTDEEKIRALETYMKTNINTSNQDNTIDQVLDLKHGTSLNFQSIYIAVAKALNIPFESVITTDRTENKFDSSFPSWNSLDEVLMYYPSIDKYLSPSSYSSRLGFPPPDLTNNKGLFVKETGLGDIKTAITKIKNIEAPSYKLSSNNIHASIQFDPESFTPKINFKHDFSGYSAFYIQPDFFYIEPAQKKEAIENLAKHIGKETIVKSSKISGIEKDDILVTPLVLESELETPKLVESAGNKYLFNVGAVIGPQEEMYQDKKRNFDGEISYAHSFTRIIEIKIPAGYKIKNLEDIKIDKKFTVDNKTTSKFNSDYTLTGDNLKITVYEDYQDIVYTKDKIEEFKGVINAAADFNKVVLIFEKL